MTHGDTFREVNITSVLDNHNTTLETAWSVTVITSTK